DDSSDKSNNFSNGPHKTSAPYRSTQPETPSGPGENTGLTISRHRIRDSSLIRGLKMQFNRDRL
ncbi:hypothetical protein KR044_003641, partial [Drosophila immigrans]